MSVARAAARQPFHLMAKPTGYQCNIACDYCFYLEKETGTLKRTRYARHMDDATLEAYVRNYIAASPMPEVEFAWQGGEPTMAGLDFYKRALDLQKKHANGKTIRNAMQTNGLLIDDAWATFLVENNFLIGLSIDGPPQLHDAHRKARNGKSVFDKVRKGLELLKKHDVEYNILSVVNATTAQHPVEVYRYLTRELGAQFLQFIPAVEQRHSGETAGELLYPQSREATAAVTDWSVSGEDYGRFIIGIFDEWVKSDVGKVYVQTFDSTLAAFAGDGPALCVMQQRCGRNLIIEQNGDIYSCDHYVYPEHKLGNIRKDNLASLVDGRKQHAFGLTKTHLPQACVTCDWRFTCHGGCPKHRIHRDGKRWHNHLCAGYKAMYAHMAPI
ncbi:anaerobic sulfatase maturase [Martelella mangrovi]|uniref:Radical SAM core domain-containing protein n=1 Tax=Martelella mangrovi TaxID=1397477 RepID=A0ABV2ID12_9HYPH